ncbi:MAG: MFS transporter [Acidimicrobiia bacterium]|nr:MFS transporter [Acidimicrobiia bacterium]
MSRTERPPLALIFAITATALMSNSLITAITPDIIEHFELSDGQVGVLVASGSVAGIVVAPLIGFLADRHGRRRVLLPCLVVYGVCSVLGGLAPTFELLLLARLLQGLGSAGLINLSVVLIADNYEGEERARLIGVNSAVLTASLAIYPTLGGLLADRWDWRVAFLPYLSSLVVAALAWRYLVDTAPRVEAPYVQQLRAALVEIRRPIIGASMVLAFVTFVLIFGVFLATMAVHLENEFGLGPSTRGLVYAVPAVMSTVAALSLGRVRRLVGPPALVPLGLALFGAAFLAIGLTGSLVVLMAGAAVYGLGEGICIPTLQDVAAGQSAPTLRGAIVALWTGCARAGQVVGPLLAGLGIDRLGTSETFVVAAVGASVAAVAVVVARPYRSVAVT